MAAACTGRGGLPSTSGRGAPPAVACYLSGSSRPAAAAPSWRSAQQQQQQRNARLLGGRARSISRNADSAGNRDFEGTPEPYDGRAAYLSNPERSEPPPELVRVKLSVHYRGACENRARVRAVICRRREGCRRACRRALLCVRAVHATLTPRGAAHAPPHTTVHSRQMLCVGGSQIPFGWSFLSIAKVPMTWNQGDIWTCEVRWAGRRARAATCGAVARFGVRWRCCRIARSTHTHTPRALTLRRRCSCPPASASSTSTSSAAATAA